VRKEEKKTTTTAFFKERVSGLYSFFTSYDCTPFCIPFHKTSIPNATQPRHRSHNFSSSDCSISTIDPLIIIIMKLVIYFVLVASMNAIDYASAAGLRLTSSQESVAAIATNDLLSSDNSDSRELLSAWCDPATPALWHP
jgi:hypothetical protein